MSEAEIYAAALRKWGIKDLIIVWLEELAELQYQICKLGRDIQPNDQRERLVEELADAEICIEQMKTLFELQGEVETQKQAKLERLKRRTGV